ncbi:MAG: fructosamine kinase family protein [Nitrosomonas sp.]|nr:fructosamine kinase family protein [Nitrosomonas sp.]MDP1951555.1 fructosamine kinase family protein [Nitrosomonas sp.]
MTPWSDIAAQISTTTKTAFNANNIASISGGCINEAFCITDANQKFFVKLNSANSALMFRVEAAGLSEIHNSNSLRVPAPICWCWGKNDRHAWLVLEYVIMKNSCRDDAAALGSGLAAMHRTYSDQFGWVRNNTIGNTPQINTFSSCWSQFWRTHRLGYQLKLARENGYTGKLQKLGEQLMAELDTLFANVSPAASLLHGDLWIGNYSFGPEGKPILFDPAVYYGDRETDIAMTELFGKFPAAFYAAYQQDYPLDSGYNTRKILYNLYHILNHLNLFGGVYRYQAEQMMTKLLVEIR